MAKILILEDSELQIRLMRFMLEEHGYEVASAANGDEAVGAILDPDTRPDALIVDLTIHEARTDGTMFMRLWGHALRDFPIVILTGDHSVSSVDFGGRHVVYKPINASQLLDAVARLPPRYGLDL